MGKGNQGVDDDGVAIIKTLKIGKNGNLVGMKMIGSTMLATKKINK